jgi:hypothetical protein
MNPRHLLLLGPVIVALVGCSSPDLRSASAVNAEANQAYFAGHYAAALQGYESARALAAESGDRQYEAIATFGAARASVQLCQLVAADKLFKQSIQLREALPDVRFAKATQNLVEYARFLISTNHPAQAVPLMERAIPDLEASGIATSDPIAYAVFYDDYAVALKASGRDSANALGRAAQLRADNPNRTAHFKPTPFPTGCTLK